jgi:acyl-CoA reductase-like NAD-dependent aldehyde dehydrogenase
VCNGVFAATGQTCMAGSRLLAQRSVHDALVDRIVRRATSIRLGDPRADETEMGPLANEPQYRKVVGPDVPFGGFGLSGLGRENGIDAVHEYTQTKAIWVELAGGTQDPFTLG